MKNNIGSTITLIGRQAHDLGFAASHNPHAIVTTENGLWACGWTLARLESLKLALHNGQISIAQYRLENLKAISS